MVANLQRIYKNIYVGTKYDFYDEENNNDFSFCLCAKTMHQMIAKKEDEDFEGYRGNMDKTEKEYLIADRPERRLVAFNLIDAPNVDYIPEKIINSALDFVDKYVNDGKKVLICCDQGMSRSAGIAFMYMIKQGVFNDCESFDIAYEKMKNIYQETNLGKGMLEYSKRFYQEKNV